MDRVVADYLARDPRNAKQVRALARTLDSLSAPEQSDLVHRMRRNDLECDRIWFADGWALSETEVKLCAMGGIRSHTA